MAQKVIHNHSYEHFADLQHSSADFYSTVESLIREYQYPDVTCSVVEFGEDGLLSPKRKYLCVTRRFLTYYVCAAPFGRSFFISWWLGESDDDIFAILKRIPILKWFFPAGKTYYQVDTELIFRNGIEAIVASAVRSLKAEHGYRVDAEIAD
jgi:hypothetical protein